MKSDVFRAHIAAEHSRAIREFRAKYPDSHQRWVEIHHYIPDAFKPVVGQVLAMMERPGQPTSAAVGQLFDLTPAELKLSRFLMSGGSLREFADQHSVSRNTARNQLQSVFQKVHVKRQVELIAVLRDAELALSVSARDGQVTSA